MNKIKVEPVDAFTFHMGKNHFNNDFLQLYIDHLDLTAGLSLYEKCFRVCDWYDEIIINKNYYINNFINRKVNEAGKDHLIIILAAGQTPLSLEIVKNNFEKINRVIEIDDHGMYEKKELYDHLYPDFSNKIKCMTADVKSESIVALLNGLVHEFYNELPCIVIIESAAFRFDKEELQHIINGLKSRKKNNIVLLEYLLPSSVVSDTNRGVQSEVFDLIKSGAGIIDIYDYDRDEIISLFESMGGTALEFSNLNKIERARCGTNKHFINENDGWLEYSAWQI